MNAARTVLEARFRAGLSQTELARRAGMPIPAVNRIERGHVVPRVDTLDRLLAACGAALWPGPRLGADVARAPIRALLRRSPLHRLQWEARLRGFRPELVLRVMTGRLFGYVAVGAIAARLHGGPVEARVVEVVPEPGSLNRERLMRALERLTVRKRRRGDRLPPIRSRGRQTVATDVGDVILWWSGGGLPGYDELRPAASEIPIGERGRALAVASVDDLIRVALSRGRKQRDHAELLGAVREEIDRRG